MRSLTLNPGLWKSSGLPREGAPVAFRSEVFHPLTVSHLRSPDIHARRLFRAGRPRSPLGAAYREA